MIEVIGMVCLILVTILIAEFVIVFGKIIYDDFCQSECEIGYVKLDEKDWEYLKEQTLKWNDDNDSD
jgi:hypothetical protein